MNLEEWLNTDGKRYAIYDTETKKVVFESAYSTDIIAELGQDDEVSYSAYDRFHKKFIGNSEDI